MTNQPSGGAAATAAALEALEKRLDILLRVTAELLELVRKNDAELEEARHYGD